MIDDPKITRIPTPMEKRLLKTLLWVWNYYGQSYGDPLLLEHRNMSAGEEATDILEEYGLAVDQGYCAQITPAGKTLMEEDDNWPIEAKLRFEIESEK